MNRIMSEVKQDKLKRKYRRKIVQENKVKEQPSVNEDIRRGIKERKELIRRKRNEKNVNEQKKLEEKYIEKEGSAKTSQGPDNYI